MFLKQNNLLLDCKTVTYFKLGSVLGRINCICIYEVNVLSCISLQFFRLAFEGWASLRLKALHVHATPTTSLCFSCCTNYDTNQQLKVSPDLWSQLWPLTLWCYPADSITELLITGWEKQLKELKTPQKNEGRCMLRVKHFATLTKVFWEFF